MVYTDNVAKVNPIKKKQVQACIEVAEKYDMVEKLIIFGSAMTDDCLDTSDVDICLEINGSTRSREMHDIAVALSLACDHNCDILKYHKLGKKFKEEVDTKGVLMYEST